MALEHTTLVAASVAGSVENLERKACSTLYFFGSRHYKVLSVGYLTDTYETEVQGTEKELSCTGKKKRELTKCTSATLLLLVLPGMPWKRGFAQAKMEST